MRRAALAAALGIAIVLGALVAVLSQQDTRLAGSNTFVAISGVALPVAPGREACANGQVVPDGTAAVRVFAGTYGRPRGEPFAVSVRKDGRPLTRGRFGAGWRDNSRLDVPLRPVDREVSGARVCVRNLGRRPIAFAGNLTPQIGPIPPGRDVIRTDWLLAGEPTWWDVAPRVVRRASVFKPAFVGAWTFWALAAVFAATCAAALALLLRRADA